MSEDEAIEAIEARLLLEGIHARYGYDFSEYAPESLQRRVRAAQAKAGTPHLGELLHRVLLDPVAFHALLDDLTVQVTEMFRDPAFHRAFRERVVPILKTYPQLRIWHAGCASGEEVYSMAILLLEEGLYERTQIYATDISQQALDRAKEGIYPRASLDTLIRNHRVSGGKGRVEDYFSSAYDHVAVQQTLKRNVFFFRHDLVTDHPFGEMNAILCRNVLIYFGRELKQRVVGTFERSLRRGGFLGLGASETLAPGHDADFEQFVPSQPIYRFRGTP